MVGSKKTYQYGIWAENLSCLYLRLKGYNILQKRYKNHFGEIDIIAFKNNTLIFIEVKARKSLHPEMEVLTLRQQKRIAKAAEVFLAFNQKYKKLDLRFDLIIFDGWLPKHLENIYC